MPVRQFRVVLARVIPVVIVAACVAEPVGLEPSRLERAGTTTARLEAFVPGTSYFGDNDYIEYIAGNLPVIFSAPHGGSLTPAGIPARVAGAACGPDVTTVTDANTEDLVRQIQSAFFARTGGYPHIVINRLARSRLDANRDIGEAACGNALAEEAWRDFQGFIDAAKAQVLADHGRGFYTDIHGHGHSIPRLELGYELSGTTLRRTDAELNASFEDNASIRTFSEESPLAFSAVLRGATALGTLFGNAGYPSVPSQQDPAPQLGQDYFNGGYNTDRHACSRGGTICGVQIEANNAGVRNSTTNRSQFATTIAGVYTEYLAQFGIVIPPRPLDAPIPGDEIIVDNLNSNNDPARARFEASSNWGDGANSQSFATNFQLATASSSATNDGAEFFFFVSTPGTYSVDAWWPAQSGRSESASYRIFELDGGTRLADLTRSQRINGAQWNSLGTYSFTQVGWAKVLMSRSLAGPGSLAADAVRITLVNNPPVAAMEFPAETSEGSSVAFSAAASTDPDNDLLQYLWAFGDGATATGSTASHAFANNGTHQVTLSVVDRYGATHAVTAPITVRNVAPVVSEITGATLLQGETYAATGSFSDPGADVWAATVRYEDAPEPLPLSGQTFALSHAYANAGSFTVTVAVHDGDDVGQSTAQVVVLSPIQGISELRRMVSALGLDRGAAASLLAKLSAVEGQIDQDNHDAVAGQIGAFTNELRAMVATRRLAETSASAMSDYAARVLRSASPR